MSSDKMNLKEMYGRAGVMSVQFGAFLKQNYAKAEYRFEQAKNNPKSGPPCPPWSASFEKNRREQETDGSDDQLRAQLEKAKARAAELAKKKQNTHRSKAIRPKTSQFSRPNAVWMENYRPSTAELVREPKTRRVAKKDQLNTGYNIILGTTTQTFPESNDVNSNVSALGKELRALPYEKYLADPAVNANLQQMLERIEQINQANNHS